MEQEFVTYRPNSQILQQRQDFSKSISVLRRVRPRVPFWQLAVHRIPTLWSLYRGLLREAPGDDIRWRLRMFFERYKGLTSPSATRDKLAIAHKFLDKLYLAKRGDQKVQKILVRYNSMIRAKRDKEKMKDMLRREMAWQERLRHRPIMTGGFLRPTLLYGPLPRLKPQPLRLSMMISSRRKKRERDGKKFNDLSMSLSDLDREHFFETGLNHIAASNGERDAEPFFNDVEAWKGPLVDQQWDIRTAYERDRLRSLLPYPANMLREIFEAKKEKLRNKRREREREQRGEILKHTLKQRQKGPPAHILAKMPAWRRDADRVIRGISEVGYVAMMKERLGRKLRDPHLWKALECGRPEDQEMLNANYDEILAENERRRAKGGGI